ncbi:MAG: cupin domain-containing protein [Parvularculaceae bacterium]
MKSGSRRLQAPKAPTFFFTVEDSAFLNRVYAGELNALTAMAKAFSSDAAPMDIDAMEGFQPADDFGDWVIPFTFHFWTRGNPETVAFGPEMTRVTHGANLGVFYYQPGLRSAWFDIRPGQHVNENENSRDNPFPSMVIMIRGEATAIIGGEISTLKEGTMMFIPAGVSHEFINEGTESAFGFLFMFGEGA